MWADWITDPDSIKDIVIGIISSGVTAALIAFIAFGRRLGSGSAPKGEDALHKEVIEFADGTAIDRQLIMLGYQMEAFRWFVVGNMLWVLQGTAPIAYDFARIELTSDFGRGISIAFSALGLLALVAFYAAIGRLVRMSRIKRLATLRAGQPTTTATGAQ